MLDNFRGSLIILLVGTVLSVSVGVASAFAFDDIYRSVTTALLTEIMVVLISLASLIVELRAQIFSWLEDKVLLIKAAGYISTTQDEIYAERYRNVILELEDLSQGRYQLSNLSAVYDDDIRSVRQLQKGEVLHSMCPVPGTAEDAAKQLSNKNFLASMSAHSRAVQRGVTVHRVYIFQHSVTFESASVKEHLRNDIESGISVYYILQDDERFADAHELPHDFIIFGSKKVSVGRVAQDSRVSGGDVYADRQSIERYRREYERLLRIAEEVKIDELQGN